MTNFNNGDRVTILPGATWGSNPEPVNNWVYNEATYIDSAHPDMDGDLHVRNADDTMGGYVHERFVKPYGFTETTNETDYVFDPGGTVIDFDSIQEGDTIAVGRSDGMLWITGTVSKKTTTRVDTDKNYSLTWRDYADDPIRLLNRPEKPADPVQVQALAELLTRQDVDFWNGNDALAAALVKAGVTAPVTDA